MFACVVEGALSRWKRESRTATRFVKYNMMRQLDKQDIHNILCFVYQGHVMT